MTRGETLATYTSSNYRKHTSRNLLQRALIERFHARLAALIEPLPIRTVLDAGCGEGFVSRYLAARLPALDMQGVDLDPHALDMARQLAPGVSFRTGDLYDLPYSADTFDLVVCTEALEHLDEPARALSELRRVSKRYCLLTVPCEPHYSLANVLRGKNLFRLGSDEGHAQRWTTREFSDFVRQRFAVRYSGTSFPWTIVLAEKQSHVSNPG